MKQTKDRNYLESKQDSMSAIFARMFRTPEFLRDNLYVVL